MTNLDKARIYINYHSERYNGVVTNDDIALGGQFFETIDKIGSESFIASADKCPMITIGDLLKNEEFKNELINYCKAVPSTTSFLPQDIASLATPNPNTIQAPLPKVNADGTPMAPASPAPQSGATQAPATPAPAAPAPAAPAAASTEIPPPPPPPPANEKLNLKNLTNKKNFGK